MQIFSFRKTLTPSLVAACIILAGTVTEAATFYVKPSSEIPLRRGQSSKYKIIAIVANGSAVEKIETKGDWSKVRLQSGKEGWMLTRYLGTTPPLDQQVTQLSAEKDSLQKSNDNLLIKLNELTNANAHTEMELTTCIGDRDDIKNQFKALTEDTADVIKTKNELAAAISQIQGLEKEMADIQIENSVLKKNETIKWFLSGSGVLLLGWIIGIFTGRSRKRRPSLL